MSLQLIPVQLARKLGFQFPCWALAEAHMADGGMDSDRKVRNDGRNGDWGETCCDSLDNTYRTSMASENLYLRRMFSFLIQCKSEDYCSVCLNPSCLFCSVSSDWTVLRNQNPSGDPVVLGPTVPLLPYGHGGGQRRILRSL